MLGVESSEIPTSYLSTPTQREIYLAQRLMPTRANFNVGSVHTIRGDLNQALLCQAIEQTAQDFEILRTTFYEQDGSLWSLVSSSTTWEVEIIDLRQSDDPEVIIEDEIAKDMQKARDPVDGTTPCRHVIYQVAERRYTWYYCYHHILLDGAGVGIVTARISYRYRLLLGAQDLEPTALSVAGILSISQFQNNYRQSAEFDTDREFWGNYVSELEFLLPELSGNASAVQQQKLRSSARASFTLTKAEAEWFDLFGGRSTSKVIISLIAGLVGIALAKQTVLIAVVSGGRSKSESRAAIVMSTLLPIVVDLGANSRNTLSDVVFQVQNTLERTLPHRSFRDFDLRRLGLDLDRADATVNIVTEFDRVDLAGTDVEFRSLTVPWTKGLSFLVQRSQNGDITFHVDLPSTDPILPSASDWAATLQNYLESFSRAPSQSFSIAELTTSSDRETLLKIGTGLVRSPMFPTVTEWFEHTVRQMPLAEAVSFNGTRLTFEAMNRRADDLAKSLRNLCIGRGQTVGILLHKSIDMVVSVIAVLKTGAAFMPMDPLYPETRLRQIEGEAQPDLVIVGPENHTVSLASAVFQLPADWHDFHSSMSECKTLGDRPLQDDVAYLLFTSGSTGRPKGVMIEHKSLVNYMSWCIEEYYDQSEGGSPAIHSFSFDGLFTTFFGPLLAGRCLDIPLIHREIESLTDASSPYCLVKMTPSHLRLFLSARVRPADKFTAVLMVGGEAANATDLREFADHYPDTALVNHFGPTETTIGCVATYLKPDDLRDINVSIGRPIWNTSVYILDTNLRFTPRGFEGELYVSGVSLTRGYLGAPFATAGRLVANPFGPPGSRMYRTGDLVRWDTEGRLRFLGRKDNQLKIRGFRVDLAEVETAISTQDGVDTSCVALQTEASGAQSLVAFVIPSHGEIDLGELRRKLLATLPAYMVPSAFEILVSLPITHNGKLNRAALPKLRIPEGEFLKPLTTTEWFVAELFNRALGIDTLGREANFFSNGGDSLKLLTLVSQAESQVGFNLHLPDIFADPSISNIAKVIEASDADIDRIDSLDFATDRLEEASLAQQRILFESELTGDYEAYNIAFALDIKGTLSIRALREAIIDVVLRHEALRTLLVDDDGWRLRVLNQIQIEAFKNLSPIKVEDQAVLCQQFAAERFDISSEIPVRVKLIDQGQGSLLLLLSIHHSATDGWSNRIIAGDLSIAYFARYSNREPEWLAPLPASYRAFCRWERSQSIVAQQRSVGSESFWSGVMFDLPAPPFVQNLNLEQMAADKQKCVWRSLSLDSECTELIHNIARSQQCSLFCVIQTLLRINILRLMDVEDLIILSAVSGRRNLIWADTVGLFVNTIPIRAQLTGTMPFSSAIRGVRDATAKALGNQDIPFDRIVRLAKTTTWVYTKPLASCFLVELDGLCPEFHFENCETTSRAIPLSNAKYPLSVYYSRTTTSNNALAGRGIDIMVEVDARLITPTMLGDIVSFWVSEIKPILETTEAIVVVATNLSRNVGVIDV